MNEFCLEILKTAFKHRLREIWTHEINITNYVRMIKHIDARPTTIAGIKEYRNQLAALLESSRREQYKEQVIFNVILEQLVEQNIDVAALEVEAGKTDQIKPA